MVCVISLFTNDCCSNTSSQLCVLTSEWTLLTWECRFPLWENDAGQNMHRWGFSPVCLAMWVCSTTFWLKAFPQWLHLKGLSPGGKTSSFNLLQKFFFFRIPSVYASFCGSLFHFFTHEKIKHRLLSLLPPRIICHIVTLLRTVWTASTLRLPGGQPNKLGCRLWANM